MIIIKYLVREALKSQLAIFFILLLIFFSQKLVKVIDASINGKIPTNLIFPLLSLGMPTMAQLILPLSLFLSLLMTFGKLYTENEITVMYACGFSKFVLVKAAMTLALFTGIIGAVNVMWVGPLFSHYQGKILAEVKSNPGISTMLQGQFQQWTDSNSVLFIEKINGSYFNDIFFAQLCPKGAIRPLVVVADSGQLEHHKDGGAYILKLNKGTYFEGTTILRDFHITNFQNYQAIIGHQTVSMDPSNTEQMDIHTLIKTDTNRARVELHWRITLVFTIFMMALMVVPLSVMNPRHGRIFSSIMPSMLLYLVFFLLQTSIKSNANKEKIDSILWTWMVNGFYLLLAIGLNIWDAVLIRCFYSRYVYKEII